MILKVVKEEVSSLRNPARAKQMLRFFKTGLGQYGEGDKFLGLTNPQCRLIAKNHKDISMAEIQLLIQSEIHEQRFIALVFLTEKFKSKIKETREEVFQLYLKKMKHVNNWDLVDLSAPPIVGTYLIDKSAEEEKNGEEKVAKNVLYEWAECPNLWFRRIAIISTLTFIRAGQFEDTLKISQKLLGDKEDLIHKGTGWMLREVGKRNSLLLEQFLKRNYQKLPRTVLRYSIQKFEEEKRQIYLKGKFA